MTVTEGNVENTFRSLVHRLCAPEIVYRHFRRLLRKIIHISRLEANFADPCDMWAAAEKMT